MRAVGVYDADGTAWGEVSYIAGKLLGLRSCSLCDITHGSMSEKPESVECRRSLPIPFDVIHRNELATLPCAPYTGPLPVVLGLAQEAGQVAAVLATPQELKTCNKDPAKLKELMQSKLAAKQ